MNEYNSRTEFLGHYSDKKIIDVLRSSLSGCDSFMFSVSFIRESGLSLLLKNIEDALRRPDFVGGTVVTTDYMRVTDVSSLETLYDLMKRYPDKFVCYFMQMGKTFDNSESETTHEYESFHTKGYVFTQRNEAKIVVGSSNMSRTALSQSGGEWSLFSTTDKDNGLFAEVYEEFKKNVEEIGQKLSTSQIDEYANRTIEFESFSVKPYFMQQEALRCLNEMRVRERKTKALIVAAMGSGKTYLSAFDAQRFAAKHILYLCHSTTVLNKAQAEYRNVFGDGMSYGFYMEGKKEKADIVFGSTSTIEKHLNDFGSDYFNYIVVDEAHHAAAPTYRKIVDYFKTDFILGMTGTPDRTDQQSIRELFGNAIPYELNLRDAIVNDLIMPFSYYGVNDDYLEDYSPSVSEEALIKEMVTVDHGRFIATKIESHRAEISGKLKCLAFCSTVEHAKKMASLMSSLGYCSEYVYGGTDAGERADIFSRLQNEKEPLEIVFSVNVLNEGVDLPKINMSLFLRPTESSIVFIQQLGRALRKSEGKKKPVIIDFVGRKYVRSTFIAMALGELLDCPVLTKPILTDLIGRNHPNLGDTGVSINMDEGSKKEISKQLQSMNFNNISMLKKNYDDFKKATSSSTVIGYPTQLSFATKSRGFDLMRIISTQKSYYRFLHSIGEMNVPSFSKAEVEFIDYLSALLPLSRPYEYLIVKALIEKGPCEQDALRDYVFKQLSGSYPRNNKPSSISFEHALKCLKMETESEASREKKPRYLEEKGDKLFLAIPTDDKKVIYKDEFAELDFNNSEFRTYVLDLIDYGLAKWSEIPEASDSGFVLHQAYSRKEFTRIICLNSVYSFQPGVLYSADKNLVGIFVDMKKKKGVEDHLNYGDKFLSKDKFVWESQTGTVIGNKRYSDLMACKNVEIFVRKFQNEDGVVLPYVYLGKGEFSNPRATQNAKKTLMFDVSLMTPITDELFNEFNLDLDN